jgi:hypothetical protein
VGWEVDEIDDEIEKYMCTKQRMKDEAKKPIPSLQQSRSTNRKPSSVLKC